MCRRTAVGGAPSEKIDPLPPLTAAAGVVEWRIRVDRLSRFAPKSFVLKGCLVAVVCLAEPAEVVRIVEERLVASVLGDVDLRPDDVVDVARGRPAAADDPELAERIPAEDEWQRAPAPGCTVIEPLESRLSPCCRSIAGRSNCAVVGLMGAAIWTST